MAVVLIQIVALVAAMAAAVVLGFFFQYRCRHLSSPFLPGGERLVIVV
jgi:hypothetical protein